MTTKVIPVGTEKWIVQYCPECRRWLKAVPAYFPVEDLKLGPICRRCERKLNKSITVRSASAERHGLVIERE